MVKNTSEVTLNIGQTQEYVKQQVILGKAQMWLAEHLQPPYSRVVPHSSILEWPGLPVACDTGIWNTCDLYLSEKKRRQKDGLWPLPFWATES